MKVKIDTKEKFNVIIFEEAHLSANMTEEIGDTLLPYLTAEIQNVILNLKNIQGIDKEAGEKLVAIQQKFYEQNCSFVICGLQKPIEKFLDENDLLEIMNVTPTESEAWDIVQMEEIEREFL